MIRSRPSTPPPDLPYDDKLYAWFRDLSGGSSPGNANSNSATFDTFVLSWGALALSPVPGNEYVRRITLEPLQGGPDPGMSLLAGGGFTQVLVPHFQLVADYVDHGFGASDGTLGFVDRRLIYFGQEQVGRYTHEAGLFYVTSTTPADIVPVNGTAELCSGGPTGCTGVLVEPNPLASGSILGIGHWRDPLNPAREHFLPGEKTYVKYDANTGQVLQSQCEVPCSPSTPICWLDDHLGPTEPNKIGWRLVRIVPGVGLPATGPRRAWWQMPCPTDFDTQRSDTLDYITSEIQLDSSGLPIDDLAICVRGGSRDGIKFFNCSNLASLARQTCTQAERGNGERMPDPTAGLQFIEATTHIEAEEPGAGLTPCKVMADCGEGTIGTIKRFYNNARSDTFTMTVPGAEGQPSVDRRVTAVAAGYVAAYDLPFPNQQPLSCDSRWVQDAGRAELTLFDITDVPAALATTVHPIGGQFPPAPPQLLRVALGPDRSTFWSVRTKTFASTGRTYAFAGDLTGRIVIFDISPNNIFPAATTPYRPPGAPGTPTLAPVAIIDFTAVVDPVDGHAPNLVDIEIDGDWLYCALARAGIGVVAIDQDPAVTPPVVAEILDTPGITQGITFMRDEEGAAVFMVVGDTRCGFRLYRRTGGG